MTFATYYPDCGYLESACGIRYDCQLKTDEHLFIAATLSKLAEGECTLQEAYESIVTNYDVCVVKFEEVK